MARFTLDTSAVLAYIRDEPGADDMERVLRDAEENRSDEIYLPFVVLMEVEYILLRDVPAEVLEESLETISTWPVEIVESDKIWRRMAARVKSRGQISLADSWVAALALIRDATLVHKDPEFDAVDGLKALRLPYDRDAGGKQ